ncbi:hypothetical protein ABFS82_04G147800 [Erythranthe guttata]
MSCIFWNCQGLGGPLTVHCIGDLIRKFNPDLVFLSETKCDAAKIEILKRKWDLFGLNVNKIGKSGGLALLWRKDITVNVLSYSQNHIDATVSMPRIEGIWRFTGFYGVADHTLRHRSWNLLRTLAEGMALPWVIGGDFNEILCNSEKIGGVPKMPGMIEAFRSTLDECGLSDLGFEGEQFTWCNNREAPHTIRSRLDRVCCSTDWVARFPE